MSDFGDVMCDKCMCFAVRVVNLCKFLEKEKHEYRISDQLFRSGTSIGANFFEAQSAISKKDFIAKIYIAQKECNESLYWLTLLKNTSQLTNSQYESIYTDCEELKKLLVTIAKTSMHNGEQ